MILPSGSVLVFASSATLFVDEIIYTPTFQLYNNWAYSNQRLREAKETNGAIAQYFILNGGAPAQAMSQCTSVTPRPLGPDNPSLINRKFVTDRYTFKGSTSLGSQVQIVTIYAQQHRALLETFQAVEAAQSTDLSYTNVVAYQTLITNAALALTNSGGNQISAAGNALSLVNGIITEFQFQVDYEVVSPAQVLYSWSLTFESRTEGSAV